MSLNASCVHRNAPVRLVSTTDFHSSQVRSSSRVEGAAVPALLNNRSSRPKTCFVWVNKSRTDEGSRTSASTTKVWEPSSLVSRTVASKGSRRRPARTTEYPSRNRAMVTCLPIPVPAPVTRATFAPEFIDRPPPLSHPMVCQSLGRREPPIEPSVRSRAHRRRERVLSRLVERGQPVGSTMNGVGRACRRYGLLDSVFREYGIVGAGDDEERARCYERKYGPVAAVVGESGHEQGVVVINPVTLEGAKTAEAAARDGGPNP